MYNNYIASIFRRINSRDDNEKKKKEKENIPIKLTKKKLKNLVISIIEIISGA